MSIFKKTLFIILTSSLFFSCGFVKTRTILKYFRFQKESTFCISDYSKIINEKIVNELNYSLSYKGFNLISLNGAKKSLQYKSNTSLKYKKDEIQEILTVKDFNSIYKIRINYIKKSEGFSNHFNADIIDMNTNQIVLYYVNANEKSIEFILKSFSEKIYEKTL